MDRNEMDMSSSINIRLSGKTKPTKKQVERGVWVKNFLDKNKRHPTLKETSDRFHISIPTCWETLQRLNKNTDTCAYCGHPL